MNEFSIIEKYFRPLTNGDTLQDDAAVIEIPEGYELVVTSDTLNAGTHFFADENPENVAHKALRVNLSDLAAMGAIPLCYQLNIAFPKLPTDMWLRKFAEALKADQDLYNIYCSGGDTTSIKGGYLSISITALGIVPKGKALHRNGAKEGDLIILTGPIGDALLGIRALSNNYLNYPQSVGRYKIPQPRLEVEKFRSYINAAADISDGLIADLGHIALASGICAEIFISHFSFSQETRSAFGHGILTPVDAITGGDDYELVLSVPPEYEKEIFGIMPNAFTIGSFKSGQGVNLYNELGEIVSVLNKGWNHF